MQLRHLPRSKSGSKYHPVNTGRPISMNDMPVRPEPELKSFPEGVERIPTCMADYSIPTLDSVTQKFGADTTKMMAKMIENQTVFEKIAWAETDNSSDSLSHAQESQPPPVCHEFQAARLFLSHFGFLSFGTPPQQQQQQQLEGGSGMSSNLHVLDAKTGGFCKDLQMLDRISPRTYDTVYLFYVRAGQTTEAEIIENMAGGNVGTLDASFWAMLPTLGWEVDVNEHAGWTGFFSTSWQISTSEVHGDFRMGGGGGGAKEAAGSCYNGEQRVLYWADVNAEIAFVVPNRWNKGLDERSVRGEEGSEGAVTVNYERSFSECPEKAVAAAAAAGQGPVAATVRAPSLGEKPRTMSLDAEKRAAEPVIPPSRRRTGANKPSSFSQSTAKIFLVWLESYEDHLTFPMEELLGYTSNGVAGFGGDQRQPARSSSSSSGGSTTTAAADCSVIFLQALGSGLLRVKLQGPIVGRMNNATPLVDGMVVNKRVIGNLVRQTAYNMAKRRRLDNDGHQPPHIKRRLKVQEMVSKFKMDLSEPELLAHLFN